VASKLASTSGLWGDSSVPHRRRRVQRKESIRQISLCSDGSHVATAASAVRARARPGERGDEGYGDVLPVKVLDSDQVLGPTQFGGNTANKA